MKILQTQVRPAEYARTTHTVALPHGVTLTDALVPSFWSNAVRGIKAGDHIELVPVSGEFYAELYVRRVTDQELFAFVIYETDFNETGKPTLDEDAPGGYTVQWGGKAKWRVLRDEDKEIMASGMDTREQAEQWIADHEAEMV